MRIVKLLGIISTMSALLLQACDPELLDPCPQPRFALEQGADPNRVVATANFEGIEDVTYKWYLNDTEVTDQDLSRIVENTLNLDLIKAGTYRICLDIESSACTETSEFCLQVTIEKDKEEPCVQPGFTVEETAWGGIYKFQADFDGMDTLVYSWYINEELVEIEGMNDERDHQLTWDFEPGTYEVCLLINSFDSFFPSCQSEPFCKEVVVEGIPCPELSFTAVEDPENVYLFTADFPAKEQVPYRWYINDELVDWENSQENETDHQLYWQFAPGVYNVCMVTSFESCNDVEFCKEIIIEAPNTCPNMSFGYEKISDTNYEFNASFEGMDQLEWYGWFINGQLVENEGTVNQGDNRLNYTFARAGTYEVCIMTETAGCPRGIEFCKTIVIGQSECEELSFSSEKTSTVLDTYIFTANFERRNNVAYEWVIYLNGEVAPTTSTLNRVEGHNFHVAFYEREATYTVCLYQVGEACGNYQVCKEIKTGNQVPDDWGGAW